MVLVIGFRKKQTTLTKNWFLALSALVTMQALQQRKGCCGCQQWKKPKHSNKEKVVGVSVLGKNKVIWQRQTQPRYPGNLFL